MFKIVILLIWVNKKYNEVVHIYMTRKKKDEKLRNRYGDSINRWEKMVKTNPEDITSWIVLGQLYERIRDWNKALECYNKALKVDPSNQNAMLSRNRLERKITRIFQKGPISEYDY